MKIRLEGTLPELADAVDQLRRVFEVQSVSRPYKNRNSDLSRVYVEAEPVTDRGEDVERLEERICRLNETIQDQKEEIESLRVTLAYHYGLRQYYQPDRGPELVPSPGGRDCPANGEHEGVELGCDECGHFLTCFAEYSKEG